MNHRTKEGRERLDILVLVAVHSGARRFSGISSHVFNSGDPVIKGLWGRRGRAVVDRALQRNRRGGYLAWQSSPGWMITSEGRTRVLRHLGKQDIPFTHLGRHAGRLKDPMNLLERIFADEWDQNNRNGRILEYLLAENPNRPAGEVTERDSEVAATVIQWLGTNVGQAFLRDVIHKAKRRAVRTELTYRKVR